MSLSVSLAALIALLTLSTVIVAANFLRIKMTRPGTLQSYLKFAYGSFLKPHSGDGSGSQQDALESFYEYQADAYDTTRTTLLRGRDDMIQLVAGQLKHKQFNRKPIWVDIGGGTGWNIEQMGRHVHVPTFFSTVYLVDLTPSLLKIAQARFDKLGWTNVKIVCMDCRYFDLQSYETSHDKESGESGADVITMSYSLTMIPDFFPVIDMVATTLAPTGIIGIVDFYAQSEIEFMLRDYVGGFLDRHCSWLNRTFWRTWFEQDRVMFDGGRRDYIEYRFGTRLCINKRNAMLPGLRIPYYIWIGCPRNQSSAALLDASVVKSLFVPAPEGVRRPDVPLPSVYYQNCTWRTYYQDQLCPSTSDSFHEEDFQQILSIQSNDVMLIPTGSGDAIFSIAFEKPHSIHAFSADARQNHVLELKLAAFQALNREEIHELLAQESHSSFRNTLIDKLSPWMSSHAVQYWLNFGSKGWLSKNNPHPKLDLEAVIRLKGDTQSLPFNAFDGLRIHTSDISDVVSRTMPGSLTVVVAGGSLVTENQAHMQGLSKAMAMKGRAVLTRTAQGQPRIADVENYGFEISQEGSKYWVLTKIRDLK